MEVLNSNYIGLSKGVMMYLTKDKYNILMETTDEDEQCYRFFTINKAGKDIIDLITGQNTLKNLEDQYCKQRDLILDENKEWIEEFIESLSEKGTVVFSKESIEQDKLIVVGDGNVISPMHATVEVTDKCNLNCKHCYLDASCEKTDVITFEQFSKLVQVLKKNKVLNIELTGGEIFVNPDAYQILELALKQFAMVGILTNGTILSDQILELMSKYKDKILLNVSIDSVNPEVHDEFRGMKGAFQKTCENVKKLSEVGLKVRVASSIFAKNMWEIDKLAELAISLGANHFGFTFIEEFGRGSCIEKHDKVDSRIDKEKYFCYVNDVIKKYQDIIPIVKDQEHVLGTNNCGAGANSILIGANGNLRPCPLYPKMKMFGNIFEETFEDIFRKNIYKTISQLISPGKENGCDPKCSYLLHCKGCYLKGLEQNRKIDSPCNWIKENKLEDVLKKYESGIINERCN